MFVVRSSNDLTERVSNVLTVIKDFGFHFRLEKCHFFYHGFIFDRKGRHPDRAHVADIQ